jgi:hypothetical protein
MPTTPPLPSRAHARNLRRSERSRADRQLGLQAVVRIEALEEMLGSWVAEAAAADPLFLVNAAQHAAGKGQQQPRRKSKPWWRRNPFGRSEEARAHVSSRGPSIFEAVRPD